MKKKKIKITNNLLKECKELRRQRDAIRMADDFAKVHSEQCLNSPPCVCCGKDGDNVRKCFFPIDWKSQTKAFGHTFAIAICPECLMDRLEKDWAFEMFDFDDLKNLK